MADRQSSVNRVERVEMSVQLAEQGRVDDTGASEPSVPPVPSPPSAWWQGVWFEGPFDPRETGFALVLALAATAAMVVVAAAVVRIAAGA
jgi:hypothetical protein